MTADARRVSGTVLAGHKEATVEMPFDPAEEWGSKPVAVREGRRGHAVSVELGRQRFASHVVARSKRHWLLLPEAVLAVAGATVGDIIQITLEPA